MKTAQWGEDPELSGPRDIYRNQLLLKELLKINHAGSILDFGCGSGHFSASAPSSYAITGIDESPSAISYCRSRHLPNAKYYVGSVNTLRRYKRKFDVVVLGEVLEHVSDDSSLLSNLSYTLKPGGHILLSVPAHKWLWDKNDDFSKHFRRYEKSSLAKVLQQGSFKLMKVYYWGFPLNFLWHRVVYLPLVSRKTSKEFSYTNSRLNKRITSNVFFVLSRLFILDNLFNWTRLGPGLIAVAKKI